MGLHCEEEPFSEAHLEGADQGRGTELAAKPANFINFVPYIILALHYKGHLEALIKLTINELSVLKVPHFEVAEDFRHKLRVQLVVLYGHEGVRDPLGSTPVAIALLRSNILMLRPLLIIIQLPLLNPLKPLLNPLNLLPKLLLLFPLPLLKIRALSG